MMDDRLEQLRTVRSSLETTKLMLSTADWRLSRTMKGVRTEKVLALRQQVGRAYQETERAERWATELVALFAGEPHPGRGRSFTGGTSASSSDER